MAAIASVTLFAKSETGYDVKVCGHIIYVNEILKAIKIPQEIGKIICIYTVPLCTI